MEQAHQRNWAHQLHLITRMGKKRSIVRLVGIIPAGQFLMGDALYKYPAWHKTEEGVVYVVDEAQTEPIHEVKFAKPFAMGRFEITIEEWQACVKEKACPKRWSDPESLLDSWYAGTGRGRYPQQFIFFKDIAGYMMWISSKTGHTYRLPSEAEWEYAARAGTRTPFWWGDEADPNKAVFSYGLQRFTFWGLLDQKWAKIAQVGSKGPNPFGLYDMLGNLFEYVADCANDSYVGAPDDGSAWLSGNCKRSVIRGAGYLTNSLEWVVVSARDESSRDSGGNSDGFRVVRELD